MVEPHSHSSGPEGDLPSPLRTSSRNRRRIVGGLLGLLAIGGLAAGMGLLDGLLPSRHVAGDRKVSGLGDPTARTSNAQTVTVIKPRRDSSLEVSVEQLANVEAYFQADLKTRVSGIVLSVSKDIGDRVRRGEVLVDIDVPDLDQEVLQKQGVVAQRIQELRVAEVKHDNALALVEVARAGVRMQQSAAAQSDATKEFRRRRLARFREMASRDVIVGGVLDEEEKEYQASVAAAESAKAAIEKAEADLREKKSSVTAAAVDIDLKRTLVEVAKRDLERSRAVAAYAQVTAPFDGVVIRRNVDPGAFVQNATSGSSEPLISVARTDLLTVVSKFPDNVAALIAPGSPVVVEADDLPGVQVTGKVTRFSPVIDLADRTVRVEVDLFNGPRAKYDALVGRIVARHLRPLGVGCPLGVATLETVARDADRGVRKGDSDPLPTFVETGGHRFVPGMTGSMRLRMGQFTDAYAVPSQVVYIRGGKTYVLLVENGKTRQVPVKVQIDDGTVAKIAIISTSGARDISQELTGTEQIVAGRQLEIGEGQPVTPAVKDW